MECKFSDALTFYTQTHFIYTAGVTDLDRHFIDRSIQVYSRRERDRRSIQGVFVLAHLVELTDPLQTEDWKLYHPRDTIHISGYFIDNSDSG